MPSGPSEPLPEGTPGRGPLVSAAHSLLLLAPRLGVRTPPIDPMELRSRVEGELKRFTDNAHALGVDERMIRTGHYALCALIDDVVLNTPWGTASGWKSQSLAGTLHHDVAAGERFYDLLDQAMAEPSRYRPLLELMHACLALGFEGKFRLGAMMGATAATVREEVAAALRRFEEKPAELSPQWKGIEARHIALAERIPLWVIAAGAVLLLALIFTGFRLRLGDIGGRLDPLVAALPPVGVVELARAAPPPLPLPEVATVSPALQKCLAPAGIPRTAVTEDFQRVRVTLPNVGMFASGRADLEDKVVPLLRCIGSVLKSEPGKITIVGHTDNVPIKGTRFASNWELSTARAQAVERVLTASAGGAGRREVRGRAAVEPVASNATAEGRAKNRRVEIILHK